MEPSGGVLIAELDTPSVGSSQNSLTGANATPRRTHVRKTPLPLYSPTRGADVVRVGHDECMDESDPDSLNADEHPPLRPNLEAMTVEKVSRLLDDVASREESWRLFELRVHEPLALPLIGERGIRDGCPLDVALDAVHYRLTFDSSRVALLPKSEAANHTRPIAVEKAPPEFVTSWRMLGNAVGDHALRARFAH